jgi:hypothetical protein
VDRLQAAQAERKRPSKPAQKREELRETLWPGSQNRVWSRRGNVGWTTIPRLLPLAMQLIRLLASKGDPSGVYMELWARSFDEGIVSITDESVCAYASGYTGTRAVRTWREHILTLAELGFIEYKPAGNREIGHILVLNPLLVCARLYHKKDRKIPEEWWTAFVTRANEVGTKIPPAPPVSTQQKSR